ncbi:MAG: hypothetical protein FJX78_05990 [Armatimonadetes bacterium]|nr:hypothetical protein [Armatimonadota bacterium]
MSLAPNQIAWLRERMPAFARANDQAEDAIRSTAAYRENYGDLATATRLRKDAQAACRRAEAAAARPWSWKWGSP